MPLARHDDTSVTSPVLLVVSTHMPLARHDTIDIDLGTVDVSFYSHASCEA